MSYRYTKTLERQYGAHMDRLGVMLERAVTLRNGLKDEFSLEFRFGRGRTTDKHSMSVTVVLLDDRDNHRVKAKVFTLYRVDPKITDHQKMVEQHCFTIADIIGEFLNDVAVECVVKIKEVIDHTQITRPTLTVKNAV